MENDYPLNSLEQVFSDLTPGEEYLIPVSSSTRFFNYLVDLVGMLVFGFLFGIFLATMGAEEILNKMPNQLLGIFLLFSYYVLLEGITGRSLGKLVTGTKVVTLEGEEPSLNTIVKRTLCRLIPFEAFSFLTSNQSGWHDRFSKTMVVRIRK
ncbi:RDD family protein [Adhaeribacter pallidiroseus]|uniref:RDD domain-containing protein n=1 Tax=Adhaeribacter pallidiroseus TaxID=2072847 RepID=A0A369QNW7_9BACT|nr:RDD family protein [Adhaeribacter pallidiroseus]RDC66424.1 hypothetical protein AHMF7616_05055 [Adhaeribacter pallidiroseus]